MVRLPDLRYEKRLWKKGYKVVVGLDEVGRGAWAGPLVVGAVVFLSSYLGNLSYLSYLESLGLDDSKRLPPRRREKLSEIIKKESSSWAVAEVPVSVINRLGMGKATQIGFRKAVSSLRKKLASLRACSDPSETRRGRSGPDDPVDFILIDAFYISRLAGLPRGRGHRLKGHRSHLSNLRNLSYLLSSPDRGRQLAIVGGDSKSISIAAASIIAKVYRDKLMQNLSRRHRPYGWGRNKGYGTKEHQNALRKYGLTRWHRKQFVTSGLRHL